jgi:hypothetical protein
MRLWDGTEIVRPTVDRGLSQWESMAGDLDEKMKSAIAAVKEALSATPWGGGAEGLSFWRAHFQGDGPIKLLDQCALLTKEISGESGRVRSAVDNTLQVDEAMRQDLSGLTYRV